MFKIATKIPVTKKVTIAEIIPYLKYLSLFLDFWVDLIPIKRFVKAVNNRIISATYAPVKFGWTSTLRLEYKFVSLGITINGKVMEMSNWETPNNKLIRPTILYLVIYLFLCFLKKKSMLSFAVSAVEVRL